MTLPMGRPMREIFGETVAALAEADPRIVMLDGDVGSSTRADIFEKAHPDRYLQMGIAEQNMLGVAAGIATMGLIPFISTFVSFAVVRPLDQIRVLIAQTGANVKITPGYAGLFTGQTGMSHIIVDDLSIMRAMPGMVTVAPADDVEAAQVLRWAAGYDGPV
ncbi:MAG: transketolase family protein, partial [Chloroflexota bacterium]